MSKLWQTLRRWAVRVARVAYVGLESSPLAPLLHVPAVQRVKDRVAYTPASRVLSVLDRVSAAGVQVWVAGGWGIDALAGRQTRRHHDLDLVISDAPGEELKVAEVLAREGFRLTDKEFNPGLFMPARHAWTHDDGHSVEVMPVALHEPPFNVPRDAAGAPGAESPFTQGSIDGRPVPCLSAKLQLTLHTGYPLRDIDSRDMDILHSQVNSPEGQVPA